MKRAGFLILAAVFLVLGVSAAGATEVGATITPYDPYPNDLSVSLRFSGNDANAHEYVTMDELREEVKAGWHKTYELNGRTLEVSVNVELPEVAAIPILRADLYSTLTPPPTEEKADVFRIGVTVDRLADDLVSLQSGEFIDHFVMPDQQAQANPLSPEQAEALARALFRQYENETMPLDLELRGIEAYSRYYVDRAGVDGSAHDFDLNEPRSSMGYYELYFRQLLHGVPVVNTGVSYKSHIPGQEHEDNVRPRGSWQVTLYSENNYAYSFFPIKEQAVLVADAPIIPFAKALVAFENYIEQGHVYEVTSASLGYMPFDDGLNDGFVLKPVWMMGCYAEADTTRWFPAADPDDAFRRYVNGSMQGVAVDAQTGEVFIPTLENKDRHQALDAGKLLTWNDVR